MSEFKIPKMAQGTVAPDSVHFMELDKIQKEAEKRSQRRHDWRIAIFGVFGGGIMGLITSIAFWLLTRG